jgi:hypothetical protein
MANSSNFLEGLFVYAINGNYITPPISNQPNFGDIPISQIVYVRLRNLPNVQGTLVPTFDVYVNNPKAVGNSQGLDNYWIQTTNFEQTLNQLQTTLNSAGINPVNSFSLYSALQQCPAPFPVINDYNGTILINDAFVIPTRKYDAGNNVTIIMLNIINSLQYMAVIVGNDQTSSGSYYYGYYDK